MILYKGHEITPAYQGYFWCAPDFDGGDIDFETATQDPHGSGTLEQCKEAIDEHLADLEFDSIGEQ